jgi:hypothetical protein
MLYASASSSFHVSGTHGILVLIALIIFVIAAVIAWIATPKAHWAGAVAAGLAVYMLSLLFT